MTEKNTLTIVKAYHAGCNTFETSRFYGIDNDEMPRVNQACNQKARSGGYDKLVIEQYVLTNSTTFVPEETRSLRQRLERAAASRDDALWRPIVQEYDCDFELLMADLVKLYNWPTFKTGKRRGLAYVYTQERKRDILRGLGWVAGMAYCAFRRLDVRARAEKS